MENIQNQNTLSPIEQQHKKDSSTAMVLGIIGDVFVWYPLIGIAGLILSIIAILKSRQNHTFALENEIRENGMNTAGKWCGIGGLIVGSILFVIYLSLFVVLALIAVGILQNSGIFSNLF